MGYLGRGELVCDDFRVEQYAQAMAMGRFDGTTLRELLHQDIHTNIPADPNWFYRSHFNPKLSPVKSFQLLDVRAFMGELVLTKIDRASMANSLEVRVPFLDHELVEYMLQLDERIYCKDGVTKHVLRENIKSVMPAQILNRQKQGFVGPDSYYQDVKWYRNRILGGRLLADALIRKDTVEKWIREEDHWRLWKIMVMECWYAKWN